MTTLPPEVLREVQRPARYVGGEPGQVLKDPSAVQARFAICFPDAYEIGMSHLGLRILYSQLNQQPDIWCERAFAPFQDMEAALRRRDIPLTTLESGTPLRELDVLGFSLQHELSYTNVLLMLDLGGISLRTEDRSEEAPLVLAGGPTAFHPEPVAPFFDAFALGDGEELAVEATRLWVTARKGGATRQQALEELSHHPSIYVPSLATVSEDALSRRLVIETSGEVTAARVKDLDEFAFPKDGPVAITEAVFDRAMIEIARGCCGGCRFCQAGNVYRPLRERQPDQILESLLGQLCHGGYDEASLTSLSTADYSQISSLVQVVEQELSARDVALSVSSLRAYGLGKELSQALTAVRTSSLTLAPEAATQRLRDVINKNISEDDIIRGAQASMTRSRNRLKLYFMLGLPTETEDDVRAIADLAKRIRSSVEGQTRRKPALTISASTFIPKPHTPLQWCRSIGPEEVIEKQSLLRGLLRPARIELRSHHVKLSMLESLLARGDRSVADLIEHAYREGARFDGWDEHFVDDAWQSALEAWPFDQAAFRAEIPLDARVPWDHIRVGPTASYLKREYRRALRGDTTSPCLRLDESDDITCHHCGLECDLDMEREGLESRKRNAEKAKLDLSQKVEETEDLPTPYPRYRLSFSKGGDLAWVGHLDTVRLVVRMARRAGMPLAYTRGFHPKPKINFAAPLPLGMEGIAEITDLAFPTEQDSDHLLELLRNRAPHGLTLHSLRRLEASEKGAASVLVAADFVLASPDLEADLDARLQAILDRDTLEATRKKGRTLDVRSALLELRRCPDDLRRELGVTDVAVLARVSLGSGPSVRPTDLLQWLECPVRHVRMFRVALYQAPLPTPLR